MKVIVCVKQIPDPSSQGSLDPGTHRLVREGVTCVLDPGDEFGIEAGLQIAEATGGEVVLLTMAPEAGKDALRKGLAMGAARAIQITDAALPGADALATARCLATAIAREGFDLVITATESTDGYTGTIPQMIAAMLEVPVLSFAKQVSVQGDEIVITRQTESGSATVAARGRTVVSVTAGANEPRYATLKGILAAKSKEIMILSLGDLGLDAPAIEQEVNSVSDIPARGAGEIVADDGTGATRIVEFLSSVKVI